MKKSTLKQARKLALKNNAEGAIIILVKKNKDGHIMRSYNLTYKRVRKVLSLATFYNEQTRIFNRDIKKNKNQ